MCNVKRIILNFCNALFDYDFQKGEYGTVSEVAGDMNIMFENAKKYNIHTSRLYKVMILQLTNLTEFKRVLECCNL